MVESISNTTAAKDKISGSCEGMKRGLMQESQERGQCYPLSRFEGSLGGRSVNSVAGEEKGSAKWRSNICSRKIVWKDLNRRPPKFRSFLHRCLRRFAHDQWRKENAIKRGGGEETEEYRDEQTGSFSEFEKGLDFA